jgi:CRP-like cAMP-binding protein
MKPGDEHSSVYEIINSTCPISSKSVNEIIDLVRYIEIEKQEVFIKVNQYNSAEYFVLEGICRSFLINPDGEEITISFFDDNSILSPYTTRTNQSRSALNFQALTAVRIALIDASKFENLMVENLEIREFGNMVLRNELKSKIEKEIGMASLTAKERLLRFREAYPLFENLIPHPTISSYLGITNISLSRLRKEII